MVLKMIRENQTIIAPKSAVSHTCPLDFRINLMKIRKISTDNNDEISQVLSLQEQWIISGLLPETYNRIDVGWITEKNTIIAEKKGKIIGYSVFFLKADYFEIDSVYVDQDFRHQNIGHKLIQETERVIKSLGGKVIKICPMTTKNKDKLYNYYKQLGYTAISDDLMQKEI